MPGGVGRPVPTAQEPLQPGQQEARTGSAASAQGRGLSLQEPPGRSVFGTLLGRVMTLLLFAQLVVTGSLLGGRSHLG